MVIVGKPFRFSPEVLAMSFIEDDIKRLIFELTSHQVCIYVTFYSFHCVSRLIIIQNSITG